MRTPLLDGIYKAAFIGMPEPDVSSMAPWGGTTADVGSEYNTPIEVSIPAWSAGSKAGRTVFGVGAKRATAKALGTKASQAAASAATKGAMRVAAPVAGAVETAYGLTKGVSDARKKGAQYGAELGKSNPFLAARL